VIKRLSHYAQEADEHHWPSFVAKYPDYVLVILPAENPDEPEVSPFLTTGHGEDRPTSRPPINDDYRVGPLTKRADSHPFNLFITVGRAGNNDIVLRDIEVSKIHAFFEMTSEGWTVRDGNSRNGTFVNENRVPSDAKTVVRSTDTVKFGPAVGAVFFNSADFYQFLRSTEVIEAFL